MMDYFKDTIKLEQKRIQRLIDLTPPLQPLHESDNCALNVDRRRDTAYYYGLWRKPGAPARREYLGTVQSPRVKQLVAARYREEMLRRLEHDSRLLQRLDEGYMDYSDSEILAALPATYREAAAAINWNAAAISKGSAANQDAAAPGGNAAANRDASALGRNAATNRDSAALGGIAVASRDAATLGRNAAANRDASALGRNAAASQDTASLGRNAAANRNAVVSSRNAVPHQRDNAAALHGGRAVDNSSKTIGDSTKAVDGNMLRFNSGIHCFDQRYEEICQWASNYERNPAPFPKAEIYAKDGTRMRSKGECLFYNIFDEHRLPNRYDSIMTIFDHDGHPRDLSPDFLIQCLDGTLIIIEHLGWYTGVKYGFDFGEKCYWYLQSGFILGKNFFVTSDDANGGTDSRTILRVVQQIERLFYGY